MRMVMEGKEVVSMGADGEVRKALLRIPVRGMEGEEEAAPSGRSPFWTVALAFFVGEMGDKTQLAAFTMAASYDSSLLVLTGAVIGMLIADSMGLVCGILLHKRLPERKLQLVSGSLFILFGILGLMELIHSASLR